MKTLIVILYNIRSTYNVGAILRSCDGLGVDKVLFAGYTPFLDKGLPHEQAKLKKQIHKTALGAEDSVTWGRSEDIQQTIAELKEQQYRIVALEQGEHSINLAEGYSDKQNIALILGEEVHGIPQEILSQCDILLEIPMCGQKESFNVSVAAGIALWELRKTDLNDKRKHLRTPEWCPPP